MAQIDYNNSIPNNVNLAEDRRLQRALDHWHPAFLDWWRSCGPQLFKQDQVYLRTAVSSAADGWANFGYVRMADYRWGIFLSDRDPNRVIPAGDDAGKPVWQEVPGEHRHALRRLIVVQADTEPASVEQQRWLAATAPSLYDCRNLFQVNVEEARHLWAMVYLLHAHFGRDGRDEADALLERRSGDEDQPRILDAFNQPCEEWLSFFCFTAFTDRDGKYQLGALAESAFDPLARTCRFLLTEEAHHLFVGETGLARIVRRSAQLMKADPNEDPAAQGGIPLDLVQRYINYWFSFCLDLFGSELSTTAGDNFMAGLKGRWREAAQYEEHTGRDQTINIPCVLDGKVTTHSVALVTGINEVLRSEYVADCEKVVARLNKVLVDEDVSPRLRLPHRRFHRRQGLHAHHHFDLDGELLTDEQWERRSPSWLPQPEDDALLKALMVPVHEPGKMANWISPPRRGIKG